MRKLNLDNPNILKINNVREGNEEVIKVFAISYSNICGYLLDSRPGNDTVEFKLYLKNSLFGSETFTLVLDKYTDEVNALTAHLDLKIN